MLLTLLATAIVLGDRAEESFRQAMLGSQGSLAIFWSNWLVGTIMTLGTILLLWPIFTWLSGKRRSGRSEPMPASAGAAAVDRQP
jgi:putative tricarboxylic transport membrane protein